MDESDDPVKKLQNLLEKLETVADSILSDQQEIVSLDRRRNANREAWRALKNSAKSEEKHKEEAELKVPCVKDSSGPVLASLPLLHSAKYSPNSWLCIGDMFLRVPKTFLIDSIEEEQKKLDCSIKEIRDGLRGKVNSLRELEGDEPSRGTNLSPLTQEEWNGVKQVLGDKY